MFDFCRAVRGLGRPTSNGRLGIEVVQVIEAVEASLARGSERVAVAPVADLV